MKNRKRNGRNMKNRKREGSHRRKEKRGDAKMKSETGKKFLIVTILSMYGWKSNR